jgi:hypothetical protein
MREFPESTENLLRLEDVRGGPGLTGSLFHGSSLLLMVING